MRRFDDDTGVFLARQLTHVSRKMYEKTYPELMAAELIPLYDEEIDEGATTFAFEVLDFVGVAAVIANLADDIPMVDLNATEIQYKIKEIADGFHYALRDVESALRRQKNLPARKAVAAREIWERTIDRISWIGDASSGLPGLFTHPSISTGSVIANADGFTDWDHKSPAEMLDDCNGILIDQSDATNGMEVPNTMGLSPKRRTQLAVTTMKADGTGPTVLKHFLENNPSIDRVESVIYCAAGQNNTFDTDVMAVWRRDPDKVARVIPQFFRLLDPQVVNLAYKVLGSGMFAGVVAFKPMSIRIYDSLSE